MENGHLMYAVLTGYWNGKLRVLKNSFGMSCDVKSLKIDVRKIKTKILKLMLTDSQT